MRYRKEIDGLRAIAVTAVILFHADFKIFNGGFIGVDIFFVISGYLITTIITDEIKNNSFSLINFYIRRAERILPALFLVVAVTIPICAIVMESRDLAKFYKSVASVPIFISNVTFWSIANDYFHTASELQPLIHTWSLAVEEQFYIVFPIFLLLTFKFCKSWTLFLLALFGITSLLVAEWSSTAHPSFSFYWIPTRAFEILAGALLSFFTHNKKIGQLNGEFLSLTGLIIVIIEIIRFDSTTSSPSLHTLIPIIGTCLILAFANEKNTTGRFLGNVIFVKIGIISYSAYLIHQPLLAILKYISLNPFPTEFSLLLVIIVFIISWIMWRYIEIPFRTHVYINSKSTITYIILTGVILIISGISGVIFTQINPNFESNATTEFVDKKIMLLGDSHAGHLGFGLQKIFKEKVSIRSFGGCIPFYNVDRYDDRFEPGTCVQNINRELDNFISDDDYGVIVLSSMGPAYLNGTAFKGKDQARVTGLKVELFNDKSEKDKWKVFEIGMKNTLNQIASKPNKKVIFALDVPELGIDNNDCGVPKKQVEIMGAKFRVGNQYSYDLCKQSRADFDERVSGYHSFVRKILKDFPNVEIFDPTPLFCDLEWCYGTKNEIKLYTDADHLSNFGSDLVANSLGPLIKKASNQIPQ